MSIKKYNLKIAKWTGSYRMDGTKCFDNVIYVKSDNYDYVFSKIYKNYSDIDIATGKIYFKDLDARMPHYKPIGELPQNRIIL